MVSIIHTQIIIIAMAEKKRIRGRKTQNKMQRKKANSLSILVIILGYLRYLQGYFTDMMH